MFCPKCKTEYQPGFERCADCDLELVHELPAESELEHEEFEELLSTYNPQDMALLKSLLEAEGITHFFQGEHSSYVLPIPIPIKLMVAKSEIKKASEVVRDLKLSYVTENIPDESEDE